MSQAEIEREASSPVEPLLPVEKKLIGWSLGIGVVRWSSSSRSITSCRSKYELDPPPSAIALGGGYFSRSG